MNLSPRKPLPLILLEINEINFDIVKEYINADSSLFPALQQLMAGRVINTKAELAYDEIEPWIQWVSVHTGKSYQEHGVFRLGDIVGSHADQIYEQLEEQGFKVGCISPMNAENRLNSPSYFIPDPWTNTKSDGSWWSRKLHQAIAQAVNDNAQAKIERKNIIILFLGLIRFARPVNYGKYFQLLLGARRAPWNKALFLDLFLHDLHIRLLGSCRPDFSSLFLNAGAHIQHHYFLNAQPVKGRLSIGNPGWYVPSGKDPVREMLALYDVIVGDYLKMKNIMELIIATGLSQQPYDRLKYYYRLRDHQQFLSFLEVDYLSVHPRMTRDFLVDFVDKFSMEKALERLRSIYIDQDGLPLFGEIEERGLSAFVTLTYPNEIASTSTFVFKDHKISLSQHVAFVALKNGMHNSKGYAFFSSGLADYVPEDNCHVKALNQSIRKYFGLLSNKS